MATLPGAATWHQVRSQALNPERAWDGSSHSPVQAARLPAWPAAPPAAGASEPALAVGCSGAIWRAERRWCSETGCACGLPGAARRGRMEPHCQLPGHQELQRGAALTMGG